MGKVHDRAPRAFSQVKKSFITDHVKYRAWFNLPGDDLEKVKSLVQTFLIPVKCFGIFTDNARQYNRRLREEIIDKKGLSLREVAEKLDEIDTAFDQSCADHFLWQHFLFELSEVRGEDHFERKIFP